MDQIDSDGLRPLGPTSSGAIATEEVSHEKDCVVHDVVAEQGEEIDVFAELQPLVVAN